MDIRSLHSLKTAENLSLDIELAGLANRVFAALIDLIIMGMLLALGTLLFVLLPNKHDPVQQEVAKTLAPICGFVVFLGFHFFQEWLFKGRTLGKQAFHIRVVRMNGQPIGFWESFGRNLLRIVDVYVSGIGFLCMLCNRSERRFGDLLAGTLVINDRPVETPYEVQQRMRTIKAAPAADTLQQDALLSEEPDSQQRAARALSSEDWTLLLAFRRRRKRFFTPARQKLETALATYLAEKMHLPSLTLQELDSLQPNDSP